MFFYSLRFFSIFISLVAVSAHAQNFDRNKVEQSFRADISQNLSVLEKSPQYALWGVLIERASEQAGRIPTEAVSEQTIQRILCEPYGNNDEYAPLLDCPPVSTPLVGVFSANEAPKLRKAFSVWNNPPSRSLFVKWFLSDLLVLALARNNGQEVTIVNNSFVFGDNLLDKYFSRALIGSDNLPIGSKFYGIPSALEIVNGRFPPFEGLQTLVQGSFFRYGGFVVDRSNFAPAIGSHTFLMQCLFMNYAAERGFEGQEDFFVRGLFSTIFRQQFNIKRWSLWAEMFAFPEQNSPRNVEYWRDIFLINSNDSSGFVRYLDSDKRPSATIVTPSTAQASIIYNTINAQDGTPIIRFQGSLGAIESTVPGSYVGFSGLEIKGSAFDALNVPVSNGNRRDISLNINLSSSSLNTLSVELIVDRDGSLTTYSSDFTVRQGLNSLRSIPLAQFVRTVRGTNTGELYNLSGVIRSYRIFFKRSANQPQSIGAIPIQFDLSPR